ncbi:MAG: DegT/DnrJ/EryC1/StrS family aminotransferase [Leptospiraceae bacterium]|nr:DegT/DnrJ/EryC1/StrS family aminotransferase [Leptospiraceae bacterium]
MGVPFIDIKRFEPSFLEEWNEKVRILSEKAGFIGGEEVANIEKGLSEYCQVKHTVACANGTDAIQLALRAVGVGRGDKVLLPDSTFWATFEAVVNCNADPYTIDSNLKDLQMNFADFEKAINEVKPKAAIIVHLYGWGSERLNDYRELCKKKNVILIEDGAQCFGVKYKGEQIYKNAAIATTSFYPAKVLGAAGDAGAVFTNDSALADKVKILANHGRTSHYGHGAVGWNSRMDSLQAAFLNLSLKRFPERLASRKKFAIKYHEEFSKLGVNRILPPTDYEENGYCNVTLFPNDKRTKLETILKEKGIGFGNIYPGAMSDQPGAKEFLKGRFGGKNAQEVSSTVLNFPLFPYMKEEEFQEVIGIVSRFQSGKD